jgi:hypothetical protein
MTQFIPEIVYEISRYLPEIDFKSIRLVFKNIIDDCITLFDKYMKCVIARGNTDNHIIKYYISHPSIQALYFNNRKKINKNMLETEYACFKFDKNIEDLEVGDDVTIYNDGCPVIKDIVKSISITCKMDTKYKKNRSDLEYTYKKHLCISYEILTKNNEVVELMVPCDETDKNNVIYIEFFECVEETYIGLNEV